MERVYTLDLHTHLNEKKVKPEKYWEKAKEIGLDAVAITEHADWKPKKAFELLSEEKPDKIVLIPGIELNSESGHILVYGKNKEIYEFNELMEEEVSLQKILETGEENGLLVCLAHPWGLSYDSIAYYYGIDELEQLVKHSNIGVETYNGMLGELSNFIYDSGWIRKPINFLDFLERNRVMRKTRITALTSRIKSTLNNKSFELVQRCASAIELGNKARFIVAGSDAHSADRLGAGILKIKSSKGSLNNESVLEELTKKEQVIWAGPLVREIQPGIYARVEEPLKRKEIMQGISYATSKVIGKKTIKKKWKKIKEKISKIKKRKKEEELFE